MIVFFSEKVFLKLAVMVTTCNSWKFAAIDWLFEDSKNEIFKNNRFSLQKFYCDVIALFEFLRYSLLPIGQMSVGSQEERLWYNVYGICCSNAIISMKTSSWLIEENRNLDLLLEFLILTIPAIIIVIEM